MKWDFESFVRRFGLETQNASGDGDGTAAGVAAGLGFGGGGVSSSASGDGMAVGNTTTGAVTGDNPGGLGFNVYGGGGGVGGVGTGRGGAPSSSGVGGGSGGTASTNTLNSMVNGLAAALFGGPANAQTIAPSPTAIAALRAGLNELAGAPKGMDPAVENKLIAAGLMSVPPGYLTGQLGAAPTSPVTVSPLGPPSPGQQPAPNMLSPALVAMLNGMASPGFANPPPGYMNMGFPAIEGVSPGLTAAPAGPSPGGVSVSPRGVANVDAPSLYATQQPMLGNVTSPNVASPFSSNMSAIAPGRGTGFQAPGMAQMMASNVAANMGMPMGAPGSPTGAPGSYGASSVGGAGVAHITQTPFQGGGHA